MFRLVVWIEIELARIKQGEWRREKFQGLSGINNPLARESRGGFKMDFELLLDNSKTIITH